MSIAPTDNTCSDTTVITLNTKNQRERKEEKNGLVRWKKKKDEERSRGFALERDDGVVGKKQQL